MIKQKIKELIITTGRIIYNNRHSKVLYYHDLYQNPNHQYTNMATSLDVFKDHIGILHQEGFEIVDEISRPDNQVMICFDDGWHGIYNVKDFLVQNDIHPTVFLAISLIGKEGYLNLDEILELQNLGFNFQGHSWNHTNLTLYDDINLKRELLESKNELSKLLGKGVDSLCFPQGYFNKKVADTARQYGYTKLYSSLPGDYYRLRNYDVIPRIMMQGVTTQGFINRLKGGEDMLYKHYLNLHCKTN